MADDDDDTGVAGFFDQMVDGFSTAVGQAADATVQAASDAASGAAQVVSDAASGAAQVVSDAAAGAAQVVSDAAAGAAQVAGEMVDAGAQAYETVSATAGDVYDATAQFAADHAVDAQDAINNNVPGVKVDFDDSDGNIGFKVDTPVVKWEAKADEAKGVSESLEVNLELDGVGKVGVKGNIGFDADGELNALGFGKKAYVPVEPGVLVGGETEWSYTESEDGTQKITDQELIGVEVKGVSIKEGVHASVEWEKDGDFTVTAGPDMYVGYESEETGLSVEEHVKADFSYGEHDGNQEFGVKGTVEGKVSVNNVDVAKGSLELGAVYSVGESGESLTIAGGASGQVGNEVYTPTAAGTFNESYTVGTDADGESYETTKLSGTVDVNADRIGLKVHGQASSEYTTTDDGASLSIDVGGSAQVGGTAAAPVVSATIDGSYSGTIDDGGFYETSAVDSAVDVNVESMDIHTHGESSSSESYSVGYGGSEEFPDDGEGFSGDAGMDYSAE